MNRVTEYTTVEAETHQKLDKQVAELITQGFQPYGGQYKAGNHVRQVMVKLQEVSPAAAPPADPGFSSAS